jgi:hypothetical protein
MGVSTVPRSEQYEVVAVDELRLVDVTELRFDF